jgi:pimeloyl-ACP methyl ester carboxylesterase
MQPQSALEQVAIRHDYAQIGDVRLHYAECGGSNDRLVILLHGFPEFWYSWRHQLPVLGERYPPYRELRIPDSGHWVQNEAVDEVNNALLEFLREGS